MRPHPTAPAIGDTVTIVNTGPNHERTGHTGIVVGGTLWTASIADHGDRVVEFPDGARLVYDAMFLRRITPTVTLLVEITVDGDASTYAGYVDPAEDLCDAVRFWAAFASPGGAPATVTVRPLPSASPLSPMTWGVIGSWEELEEYTQYAAARRSAPSV